MLHTYASPDGNHKIIFDMTFRSGLTDTYARMMLRAIKEANAESFANEPVLTYAAEHVCWILSTTRRIKTVSAGDEPEPFKALIQFWLWAWDNVILQGEINGNGAPANTGFINAPALLAETWQKFNELVSVGIQEEWYRAFVKANEIFPAPLEIAVSANVPDHLKGDDDFLA